MLRPGKGCGGGRAGWAHALEPCKIRYLVTPTFATLRRNGRSRHFDPIFTIENQPPRPRELPRHPRLLDASQMPPHMVPPPGFLSKDCSSRIPPGFLPQDSSSRIPPPGFLLQDSSSRIPPPGCLLQDASLTPKWPGQYFEIIKEFCCMLKT